jgi:hypothetical protein
MTQFSNFGEWELQGFPIEPIDVSNALLVYVHVPKAAGNSSIKPIKDHYNPAYSVQWNNLDQSWQDFLNMQKQTKKYRLVSGHINDKHLQLLSTNKINSYLITFLRHPLDRIKSLYAYNCMKTTPGSATFIKKYNNYEEFALTGVTPNSISRQLFSGALSSWEAINKLKRRYQFIGLSNQYELSMTVLSKLIGIKKYNLPRQNVSSYNEKNYYNLSRESIDTLKLRHSVDMDIYNYVANAYQNIGESIIKTINERS